MKKRFLAREVALVSVPTLALGAFGIYAWRVENVGPRGLYVEKSELLLATPLDMSRGYSHHLKVTLNYGGWKPKSWMSDETIKLKAVDPLHFPDALRPPSTRKRLFVLGNRLTVKRGATWGAISGFTDKFSGWTVESGHYIFTHRLRLSKVPPQAGEVQFHSVYALGEAGPVSLQKVVRRAGQKISLPVDRDTRGTIDSFRLNSDWRPEMGLEVWFKHLPREDGKHADIAWEDIEVVDSMGRIFRGNVDFSPGGVEGSVDGNTSLSWAKIHVFDPRPSFKAARPPLTLRGKVSINQGWPLPFSHRLSP